MRHQEYWEIGKRLFSEGLVAGNLGNLSIRGIGGFYITATGAFLDRPGKWVYVPFEGAVPSCASSEHRVHREVYMRVPCSAIVHTHPPFSVTASFILDEICPRDSWGKMLCPRIPVIEGEPGTQDLATNGAAALEISRVVIARAHGTFAAARSLEEAYLLTSAAEHSCRILYYSGYFGGRSR